MRHVEKTLDMHELHEPLVGYDQYFSHGDPILTLLSQHQLSVSSFLRRKNTLKSYS